MKRIALSWLALAAFSMPAVAETNAAPANLPPAPAPAPAAGPAGGTSVTPTTGLPASERANQDKNLRAVKSGNLPGTVKPTTPRAHKSARARQHHRHGKLGGHSGHSHRRGHRHHRRHK